MKEGGSVLGGSGEMPSVGQGASDGYSPRYDQRDMRKSMIRKHESSEMTIERRKAASQSAVWAKENGVLPELPLIELDRTGTGSRTGSRTEEEKLDDDSDRGEEEEEEEAKVEPEATRPGMGGGAEQGGERA